MLLLYEQDNSVFIEQSIIMDLIYKHMHMVYSELDKGVLLFDSVL